MRGPTWTLEEHAIRVASVDMVHRSEGCVVVEVDCVSKYAQATGYMDCGDVVLMLCKTKETLSAAEDDNAATTVTVYLNTTDWEYVIDSGGRYSHRMILWQRGVGVEEEGQ